MYDIQGALRRRAMAERLEALSRADEATQHAVDEADVPPPLGPRHLASWRPGEPANLQPANLEPAPVADVRPVVAGTVAPPQLEVLAKPAQVEPARVEAARVEPARVEAAQVAAPAIAAPAIEAPAIEAPEVEETTRRGHLDALPLGVTPLEVPRTDLRPVTPVGGDLPRRLAPTLPPHQSGAPITPAAGMLPAEPQTAERFVARAPDRTNRFEGPASRLDQADQSTRGGTDLSVPPGVTLLHDTPDLLPRAPLSLGDGVIDLTVIEDGPADQAAAAPSTEIDDLAAGDLAVDDLAADEAADTAADATDDSDPAGESSASAIADMLRHGGSGLFFKR